MKQWIKSYHVPVILRALNLMGRRKRLFLCSVFVLCAVEIAGSILYASGMRGAIGALSGTDWWLLAHSVMRIVLSHAIWWIWAPVSSYCCSLASKGTVQGLKTGLFEHIIKMPMSDLDNRSKGELISNLTNDIGSLSRLYDWFLFQIFRTALAGTAGVALMAWLDWRFAIVVFAFGSISVLVSSRFNQRLEHCGETLQKNLADTSTDTYELMKGAKTIRLLKLQDYFFSRIADSTSREADTKTENGRITSRLNATIAAVNASSYAAILIAGALFVQFNLSDWGTVVALMGLKITSDMLFVEFPQFMTGTQSCVAGIRRLFALLDAPTEGETLPHVQISPANPPLRFDAVSFAYADQPVLEHFNMTVNTGQITALIGESGSGKSTAMKLALGLYSPQSGQLVFSGSQENTIEAIRKMTAYVPQEPLLFRGSILENILCGNAAATRDDAVHAAKLAGADGFISTLPSGYDTMLVDNGKNLSGGQQQRISIARALVKNAPILLLDEITSALDAETETHLLETMQDIAKTRAVFFITHKREIEAAADTVYHISGHRL